MMANTMDILKIQKTIRKAIKDYAIVAKHDDEALVSLVSVDLYLALDNRSEPATAPSKRKLSIPSAEVTTLVQTTECN